MLGGKQVSLQPWQPKEMQPIPMKTNPRKGDLSVNIAESWGI